MGIHVITEPITEAKIKEVEQNLKAQKATKSVEDFARKYLEGVTPAISPYLAYEGYQDLTRFKGTTMNKPIFKFSTEKPPAATIWTTVDALTIEPSEGHTDFQIKFIIFCTLQLTDWNTAKKLVNDYIASLKVLLPMISALAPHLKADFTALKYPLTGLPIFVEDTLYTPYYLFKQLKFRVSYGLWFSLFDRSDQENITQQEIGIISADLDPTSKSITVYKLWYYGTDIITDRYNDIFTIHNPSEPVEVQTLADVHIYLKTRMIDWLEETPSHIFDYTDKIVLPPFKLRTTDEAQ